MFQFQIEARDERDIRRGTTSYDVVVAGTSAARNALAELAGEDPRARAELDAFAGLEDLTIAAERYPQIRVCPVA